MSAYTVSSTMSNATCSKLAGSETNSEGQDLTLLHGLRLTRPDTSFSYADAISSPLISRARSTLAPFPDGISMLTPTLDYLSTGGPRLVPVWKKCCACENQINPSLAPEKCAVCSHTHLGCSQCVNETVPA